MDLLLNHIAKEVERIFGRPFELIHAKPISGGSINRCYKLDSKYDQYFVKINDAVKYPKMFHLEKQGLELLNEKSSLNVPEVHFIGEYENHSFLVMEWIESSYPQKRFWEEFGHKLAKQHQIESQHFGFSNDNYIGSLVQYNKEHSKWSDFFIEQRLRPQLKYGLHHQVFDTQFVSYFETLFPTLSSGFFPEEQAVLLHGDLWSGNFCIDQHGEATIFDPAVYYGNREMEFAFTKLFGGFDHSFYESYQHIHPLESGFEDRVDIYNLYSLLVHVNLFGGNYKNEIMNVLKRFVV